MKEFLTLSLSIRTFVTALLLLISAGAVRSATIYWDGAAGPAAWGTAANWATASGATPPDAAAARGASDDAIFNITTANGATINGLGANQLAQSLTFNNTGTTAIRGNTSGTTARVLTLGSGGMTLNSRGGAGSFCDTPPAFCTMERYHRAAPAPASKFTRP